MKSAPAIDPVKHAKVVTKRDPSGKRYRYCSNCGRRVGAVRDPYCSRCGAKLDSKI